MMIELSDDQALVLFELLSQYGEKGNERQLAIREAAERNVLWAMSGILEKQLVAPLQKNYVELLSTARARIVEHGGPGDGFAC